MERSYYLHRISHEGNVSYSLMDEGIITLGWSKFSDTEIMRAAREEGYPDFNPITEKLGEGSNRSRWCMWYFAQMKVGDYVLVPLYEGKFSVFEVIDQAKPIMELEKDIPSFYGKWDGHNITWNDGLLFDEAENRGIDLGFFIRVKPVVRDIPRSYAVGKLISRMKIRSTSADITDLADLVETSVKAGKENKPITLYGSVIDSLVKDMRNAINVTLSPDEFEHLIKWYLKRCGATSVWIPAKNQSGKKDGADADVIAEFDNLKYIVYVQAKLHEGETSDWAVYQINSYKEQMSEGDSDFTYATWVISAADEFSQAAVAEAEEKGVRLINGNEFARMLLDIGLLDINDAFEKN